MTARKRSRDHLVHTRWPIMCCGNCPGCLKSERDFRGCGCLLFDEVGSSAVATISEAAAKKHGVRL